MSGKCMVLKMAGLILFLSTLVAGCSKASGDIVVEDTEKDFPQFHIQVKYEGKTIYEYDGNKNSLPTFYLASQTFPNAPTVYPLVHEEFTTGLGYKSSRNRITLQDGSFFLLNMLLWSKPKAEDFEVIFDERFKTDFWSRNPNVRSMTGHKSQLYFWGENADGSKFESVNGSFSISNVRAVTYTQVDPTNGQNFDTTISAFDGKFSIKYRASDGKEHKISGYFKNKYY